MSITSMFWKPMSACITTTIKQNRTYCLHPVQPAPYKYCKDGIISVCEGQTRSLSSSHPRPPAPITKIWQVVWINSSIWNKDIYQVFCFMIFHSFVLRLVCTTCCCRLLCLIYNATYFRSLTYYMVGVPSSADQIHDKPWHNLPLPVSDQRGIQD